MKNKTNPELREFMSTTFTCTVFYPFTAIVYCFEIGCTRTKVTVFLICMLCLVLASFTVPLLAFFWLLLYGATRLAIHYTTKDILEAKLAKEKEKETAESSAGNRMANEGGAEDEGKTPAATETDAV